MTRIATAALIAFATFAPILAQAETVRAGDVMDARELRAAGLKPDDTITVTGGRRAVVPAREVMSFEDLAEAGMRPNDPVNVTVFPTTKPQAAPTPAPRR